MVESEPAAAGDPAGRRLARQRAERLAEAGRVASALISLLRRADFDDAPAVALATAITDQEQIELLRASGRVESRRRFKGGPIVRHVAPPDRNLLFIDESGKSLPSGSPYFALGGISMTGAEAERYKARANAIKDRFWGHSGVTLHEPKMRHREADFYFGGDEARQVEFDAAIDELVGGTEFVVFGIGIRKDAFARFVGAKTDVYLPSDMYAVAIQMLLERYVDYRASGSTSRTLSKVIFESQGPVEDAQHQRDYADVLLNGTQWIADAAFQQWLETGVEFTPKQGSDPMELADMLARDLYEWLAAGCAGWPGRWKTFSSRVYCRGDGRQGKFGIKVFPDSDIRCAVEQHRADRLDLSSRAAGR